MRDLMWLMESFKAIDRVYFDDALSIEGYKIKWMPWRPRKKSFIFGLCDKERKVIEINQALRHDWVPGYVILSTVYHEMLHIALGSDHDDHGVTFDLAESKFPHHAAVQVFEETHLNKLINCERPGAETKEEKFEDSE